MLSKLMDAMFGCRHARYSFRSPCAPVRAATRRSRRPEPTSCSRCGKEFRYNWQEMKIMDRKQQGRALPGDEEAPKTPNRTAGKTVAFSTGSLATQLNIPR